jgi:hypothetical protein
MVDVPHMCLLNIQGFKTHSTTSRDAHTFYKGFPSEIMTVREVVLNDASGKSFPATGLERPLGFQEVEAPEFLDNRYMKVVRLSAPRTGRFYLPGKIPGPHFCQRLNRSQVHSAARNIKSPKNSSDLIGNRTRDFPACSAVPQSTAPPRTPPPPSPASGKR